jgi:hypothetical protein
MLRSLTQPNEPLTKDVMHSTLTPCLVLTFATYLADDAVLARQLINIPAGLHVPSIVILVFGPQVVAEPA